MNHLENILWKTVAKFNMVATQLEKPANIDNKRLLKQKKILETSIKKINDEMDALNAK